MNDQDLKVIESMERYGGSFVVALAEAARRADHINLAKIKTTWSNYWQDYSELAGIKPKTCEHAVVKYKSDGNEGGFSRYIATCTACGHTLTDAELELR